MKMTQEKEDAGIAIIVILVIFFILYGIHYDSYISGYNAGLNVGLDYVERESGNQTRFLMDFMVRHLKENN